MGNLRGAPRDNVGVGIVGCGNIAVKHLEAFANIYRDCRIVCCDLSATKARFLAERNNLDGWYTSVDEMLEDFHPGRVHLTMPPVRRVEMVEKLLRAGVDIYVEKPFAASGDEAGRILELAAETGRVVVPGHCFNSDDRVVALRRDLAAGRIGDVIGMEIRESFIYDPAAGSNKDWMNALPGQMISDLLPHYLTLATAAVGKVHLSHVEVSRDDSGRAVGVLLVLWAIEPGSEKAVVTVNLDFRDKLGERSVDVRGTDGRIWINFLANTMTCRRTRALPGPVEAILLEAQQGLISIFSLTGSVLSKMFRTGNSYQLLHNAVRDFHYGLDDGERKFSDPEITHNIYKVLDRFAAKFESTTASVNLIKACPAIPGTVAQSSEGRGVVAVTGASGFLGRAVIDVLSDLGLDVRILTTRADYRLPADISTPERFQILPTDYAQPEQLQQQLHGVDTVVHMAAATAGNLMDHIQGTVGSTEAILAALDNNPNIKALVYVSSLSVLDASQVGERTFVDETFPLESHPSRRGAYAQAKQLAEERVQEWLSGSCRDIRVSIVRPGVIYSEGRNPLQLIKLFSRRKCAYVVGPSGRRYPFVHRDNVASLIGHLIEQGGAGIFNVVDEVRPSLSDIKRFLDAQTSAPVGIAVLPPVLLRSLFPLLNLAGRMFIGREHHVSYKLRTQLASGQFGAGALASLSWTPPRRDSQIFYTSLLSNT